jgi:transcriptional regulator with XRE-family HTH domain
MTSEVMARTPPPREDVGVSITVPAEPGASVGALLRRWRERRRLSQLELSHLARVSTRHLSYLENGRSSPTAEMVLRLAEELDVPLDEQDHLLLSAGFAPRHGGREPGHDDLAEVMRGLRGLLDAHLPYPALLLDRRWDVVDANGAVDVLLAGCDPELLEPPVNALRVTLHPGGLAPRIHNLDEWADHLLRQVAARHARTHDPAVAALLEEFSAHLGRRPASTSASPVLALDVDTPRGRLRLFSVAAQLERPTDSTLQGLTLETFLPADEETRSLLLG